MRFMMMVRANELSEAGGVPDEKLINDMIAYHEDLARAGVLLDGTGLHPSARGKRIRYTDGRRTVIDGPFAEAKELIAGYTIIQAKSWDEAMEWARRFPAPFGEGNDAEIEIRQLMEIEDFAPIEAVDRFRSIGLAAPGRGESEIRLKPGG